MFNKKLTLISLVMLLVLSVFVFAGWLDDIGLPPDYDEGDYSTYSSTLEITEINAKVDGKKDTITTDGEKISREAKQESNIEFEINVKNIWDKNIEDIEVTVIINDIDDGDDMDEDDDIGDLEPGNSEEIKIEFDLPLKVDDGNYDVEIHVEGNDEDNNLHIIDWTLTLEVKKEKHNVIIEKASLYPSSISCGRTTNLEVEILNLGREEEEVNLEVKNEYLSIDLKEEEIDLDTGTDDDAEYEKTFRLNIPENVEAGTYPIDVKAYYNKDSSAAKKVNLLIEECTQTKQSGVSIKSLPPSPSETLEELKTKTPETIIYTTDESMILLLTIILIIVLGLIIFLLGVIMIQLRR